MQVLPTYVQLLDSYFQVLATYMQVLCTLLMFFSNKGSIFTHIKIKFIPNIFVSCSRFVHLDFELYLFLADGFTYERLAIEAWLANNKRTSPMTNELLQHLTLTPNRTLRTLIQHYREENL